MSSRYIHVTVALSTALLAGCASGPQFKQPPAEAIRATSALVSEAMPTSAQKFGATSIDQTYFAVGGATGSLAVGLAFGAIGALANAAYVTSVNESRAEKITEVTSTDLAKLLRKQVPSLNAAVPDAATAYKLTPAGNIWFKSDTEYWLGCTIAVELPQADGSTAWSGRYASVVDGLFDAARPGDNAKAVAGLASCLQTAYGLFQDHISGKLGPFEQRTVSSPSIDGKRTIDSIYQVAVSRLPDHVFINDGLGVAELRSAEITQIK